MRQLSSSTILPKSPHSVPLSQLINLQTFRPPGSLTTFSASLTFRHQSSESLSKSSPTSMRTNRSAMISLKAWNDWRAINEDYPSLPGPSGVLPGSSAAAAGSGGRRVLKLKNSTTQSSSLRSVDMGAGAMLQDQILSQACLPRPIEQVQGKSGLHPGHLPAHLRLELLQPQPPARRMPVVQPNGSSSASEAFPALPVAARPSTLMAGLTRGTVRWDDFIRKSANASPWANGATTQPPTPMNRGRSGASRT